MKEGSRTKRGETSDRPTATQNTRLNFSAVSRLAEINRPRETERRESVQAAETQTGSMNERAAFKWNRGEGIDCPRASERALDK